MADSYLNLPHSKQVELARIAQEKRSQLGQGSAAKQSLFSQLTTPTAAAQQSQPSQTSQNLAANLDRYAQEYREREDREVNTLAAGVMQGGSRLVQGVGTLYGLASGDMDNLLRTAGGEWADNWQDRKPYATIQDEEIRTRKVQEAEGELAKFGTAFWETVKNPRLLGTLVAEQLPNLAAGGVAGRVVGTAGKLAGASQAAQKTMAGSAAIGTSSGLHGADVAGSVYDDLLKLPEQIWNANPEYQALREEVGDEEAKKELALRSSRLAGAAAAGVSLASMKIPGMAIPERVLSGTTDKLGKSALANAAKGVAGETAQEAFEEGSGVAIGNLSKRLIDPEQSITEGVGESAGLGAAGGGFIGGVTGALATELPDANNDLFNNGGDSRLQSELAAKALETGELGDLVNPDNKAAYNPVRAAAVLAQRSANADLPTEARTAAQTELDSLVDTLTQKRDTAQKQADDPQEILRELDEEIAQREAQVEARVAAGDPREMFDSVLQPLYEDRAEVAARLPETQKAQAQRAKSLSQQLESIAQLQSVQQGVLRTQNRETVASLVQEVTTPSSPEAQTRSASQLIELAMRDAESLDAETAQQLSENTAFTAEQRRMFKAFSATHAHLNSLKEMTDVQQNILLGAPGFKGLEQYRTAATQAISKGRPQQASAELAQLRAFQADHKTKTEAIQKAAESAPKRGRAVHVVRDPEAGRGWSLKGGKAPWTNRQEQAENGGWTVGTSAAQQQKTAELLQMMAVENDAIASMIEQIESMMAVAATQRPQSPAPTEQSLSDEQYAEDMAVQEASQQRNSAAQPSTQQPEAATQPVEAEQTPSKQSTTEQSTVEEQQSTTEEESESVPVQSQPEAEAQPAAEVAETEQETVAEEANTTEASTEETLDPLTAALRAEFERLGDEDAETEAITEAKDGKLSVIQDNPKDLETGTIPAERFSLTNLITAYFRQVGGRAKVANPLVAVPDFMTSLVSENGINEELLRRYLPEGALNNQDQVNLIFRFEAFRQQVRQNILDNIRKPVWQPRKKQFKFKDPSFWYQDYVQFLRGAHPEVSENSNATSVDYAVDENLFTAIALAGFSWVMENGSGLGLHTDKQINAILGNEDNDPIGATGEALRAAGERQSLVVGNLGKRVAQSLGLKTAKGAPENVQVQLELALGAHVLAMLQQQQLTVRTEVTLSEGETATPFIRAARDQNHQPLPQVANIADAGKGTQGILGKLFSFEESLVPPALEPGQFNQKQTKTGRSIPKVQQEAASNYADRPWSIRQEMVDTLNRFSSDVVERMAGVVSDDDMGFVHAANKTSQQAKNDAIRRGMARLNEFRGILQQAGKTLFYLPPDIWLQQRAGLASNMVNPQQDKFQRHLVGLEAWRTTLDPQADANSEKMLAFRLAVAQGLGVDVDKLRNEQSLDALESIEADPLVEAAVDALRHGDPLTEEEQDIIATVVRGYVTEDQMEIGGGRMHTLDALVNLAAYRNALDSGTSFETSITYEVDGVTNGPALSLILLGAANTRLGERFGFYTQDSGVTEFTDWKRQNGAQDIYERLATIATHALAGRGVEWWGRKPERLRWAQDLMRNNRLLNIKRSSVKTPLTAFMFGSSPGNAVKGMALRNAHGNGILDNYYKGLEKAARNDNLDEAILIVQDMNRFLRKDSRFPMPRSAAEGLTTKFMLSPQQESQLVSTFSMTIGKAVEASLKAEFGAFIEARNEVNITAAALFERYNTARNFLINERLKQRTSPRTKDNPLGETIAVDGAGRPLQSLPQSDLEMIENRLKPLAPIVHTAMSKMSGELDAGLNMYKLVRQSVQEDMAEAQSMTQQVQFGQTVPTNNPDHPKGSNSLIVRGMRNVLEAPGVAPVILLVHALDSAIASMSYKDLAALNVHDALGLSINDLWTGGKALNRNTFEILKNYSLPREIAAALERSFDGAAQLEKDFPGLKEALEDVTVPVPAGDGVTIEVPVVEGFVQRAAGEMAALENRKQNYLSQIVSTNQYALEGGAYIRDAAEVLAPATEQVTDQVANQSTDQTEQVAAAETATTEQPGAAADTSWGKVGKPRNPADPVLVRGLEQSKTVKDILPTLASRIKATAPNARVRDFQLRLLGQISQIIDLDLPLDYITPDSIGGVSPKLRTANAWYRVDENGRASIGIKSPDFVHSKVTAETLLHELVHAVTATALRANHRKGSIKAQAVAELEQLLTAAQERVNAQPELKSRWSEAVSNLDEFLAWGMSNPNFQREVLWHISADSSVGQRRLRTGIRDFINSLATLLFGDKADAGIKTGLGQLITNTAILMGDTSQANNTNNNQTIELANRDPHTFSTDEVFEALGRSEHAPVMNPAYTRHLKGVLDAVVSVVYGNDPVFKQEAERNAPVTADDVYLQALNTGEAPFASAITALGRTNDQEAFVLESLEVTLQDALKRSPERMREARKLFMEAREALKNDPELDASDYELLFTLRPGDNTERYLARFLSASLAYQPVHTRLSLLRTRIDTRSVRDQPTWGARLQVFIEKLLAGLQRKFLGIREGDSFTHTARHLAEQLARLEARHKTNLSRQNSRTQNLIDKVEDHSAAVADKARQLVERAGKSDFFRNRKLAVVRATGMAASTIAGDRVGDVVDLMQQLRDKYSRERLGLISEIWNEMRGETDDNTAAHALLIQGNNKEQAVKRLMDEVARRVRTEYFSKPLTQRQSTSLTQAIRGDMARLLDDMGIHGLQDLLTDQATLRTAIDAREAEITQRLTAMSLSVDQRRKLDRYFKVQGRALAYFMMTGKNRSPNLMMNTHNIASLYNTQLAGTLDASQVADIDAVLDPLVSLYALQYMKDTDKAVIAGLIRQESQRGGEIMNGVEKVLREHLGLQQDAREHEFQNNPIHLRKGYAKEIYNPFIEVRSADLIQGAELEAAGYTRITTRPLPKDPSDPTGPERHLYTLRGRGLDETITGFMGSVNKRSKGTRLHSGIADPLDPETAYPQSVAAQSQIDRMKNPEIDRLFDYPMNWAPESAQTANYMAPILNLDGRATNYRYLMEEATKDQVLERDNRIEKVLGHTAGSLLNKQQTPLLNQDGITLLHEMYQAESATRPEAFIEFSPTSSDPVIRERYRLLPDETKRYIRDVWGGDRMMVRKDVYNLAFGYRKFSVGKILEGIFDKDGTERNRFEKFIVGFFETVPLQWSDGRVQPLGRKAALVLLQSERGWQELVRMVKDIWVIKNLVTLLGNEFSNMTMLFLRGVPPHRIVTGRIAAWRATIEYKQNERRRNFLQSQLELGVYQGSARTDAEQEILVLNEALQQNPVHVLMEAGMYQTLVEDLSVEDDPYSYQSRLSEWAGRKTAWMPRGLKTVGKNLLMTHDTVPYKLLNEATIMSDFGARYILHEHLTTRRRNPLTQSESLRVSRAAFVNYDVPTHRGIQYLNDMGVLPFTKYYLRIQRALLDAVRSSPGRTVALLLLGDILNTAPTILESSLLEDPLPGSLSAGAFELPGAIKELATLRWAF